METRNIVVVGAKRVGKSALVHQLIKNEFLAEYKATRHSAMKSVINENTFFVTEVPGYENTPADLKLLPGKPDAALVVFSVTDRKSFDELSELIKEVREKMQGPIILVGNKSDLIAERAVTRADVENFAREANVTYIEVSAKNPVNKIFQNALDKIENPANIIEILVDNKLDELNAGELKELITEVGIKLKDVGKSRVEMRDEALGKCRKANDVGEAIAALEACAEKAQKDHVERSGARLVFGKWGPLFKSVSKTKQTIDEIVLKYKQNMM